MVYRKGAKAVGERNVFGGLCIKHHMNVIRRGDYRNFDGGKKSFHKLITYPSAATTGEDFYVVALAETFSR